MHADCNHPKTKKQYAAALRDLARLHKPTLKLMKQWHSSYQPLNDAERRKRVRSTVVIISKRLIGFPIGEKIDAWIGSLRRFIIRTWMQLWKGMKKSSYS